VACDLSSAPTFTFVNQSLATSSCLDLVPGNTVAYITTYVTSDGNLNMLINGSSGSGYLDVAVYNVPSGLSPCDAIQDVNNELQCNYADFDNGCNQLGTQFPCMSSVPAPYVTAGQTLIIVVENWSGLSSFFSIEVASSPDSAQLGLPDATINTVAPFCVNDSPYQMTAVNNGGNWSGAGISTEGIFSPSLAGLGTHTIYYSIGTGICSTNIESITVEVLDAPSVPTITTTSATCSSDGESTITNIDPSLTYVFSPTGPTVDLTTGVISGMVLDTPYTVHSNNGDCDSAASASFTNDTMLVTPAVPVISTASATCSSDGESTITNIDPSLTYVFSPTGPTVDLTTGVISGMVVGTSYTVYAGHGSCSSTLSSGFVNDPMQSNPTFTGISNGGVICSGNTADFYLQGTPGANVLYSVNGGSNVTIPLDASGQATVSVPNASTNVTLTVINIDNGCVVAVNQSNTVTVNPLPTIINVSNNGPVCENGSGQFTITGTPNTRVSYSLNGGVITTVNLNASGEGIVPVSSVTANQTIQLTEIRNLATTCFSTVTNSSTLIVNPLPTASFTIQTPSVCNNVAGQIDFTGTPNAIITITDGTTNYQVTLDSSGNYTGWQTPALSSDTTFTLVDVTSTAGCTRSIGSTGAIIIAPTPRIIGLTYSEELCSGDSLDINFTTVDADGYLWTITLIPPASGGTSFVYNGDETQNMNQVIGLLNDYQQGEVLVSITPTSSSGLCQGQTVNIGTDPSYPAIYINPVPQIDLGISSATTAVCTGDTISVTANSSYAGLGVAYHWYADLTGVSTSGSISGISTNGEVILPVEVTNTSQAGTVTFHFTPVLGNCTGAEETITITVNPNPVKLLLVSGSSYEICSGDTVASGIPSISLESGSVAGTIIHWQAQDIYNVDGADVTVEYQSSVSPVNVTDILSVVDNSEQGYVRYKFWTTLGDCMGVYQYLTVYVNPLPEPVLEDSALCVEQIGGTVFQITHLNAGDFSGGNYQFRWYKVDTAGDVLIATFNNNSSIEIDEPGDYYVVVSNLNTTCSSVSNTVTVYETVPANSITTTVTDAFSDNATIAITITGGTNGTYLYQLDEGSLEDSNIFTGVSAGEHLVTVVDTQGCTFLQETVMVIDYPKYFTPNGDGINDTWNIVALNGTNNVKIYIFDRYGKVIKQISPSGEGWNGTFNGRQLPSSDYWFTIEYVENQILKEFRAHFSLKR
jgi:gliding motility-associated-like protein